MSRRPAVPFWHLVTLSTLAIAQPLFDILARHVQFFVTSNSSPLEIIGLAVVALAAPALLLFTLQRFLGVPGSVGVLFVLASLLFGRLCSQLELDNAWLSLAVSLVAAAIVSALYFRLALLRSFVDFLSVACVVVPAVFLYQVLYASSLGELNRSTGGEGVRVASSAPLFFVIIDEVPTTSLQAPDGSIDALRFPNFARLATSSTWYRNATTVADSTEVAIPAMLTGKRPDPAWDNPTASASRHPRNLFTALAGSYQVNAFEPVTALCPPSICASSRRQGDSGVVGFVRLLLDASVVYSHLVVPVDWRRHLPAIDQYWSGFFNKLQDTNIKAAGSSPRQQFLQSLDQAQPSSLNFVHIYLPHVPWRYLPSGHVYASHPRDYKIEGFDPQSPVNLWLKDERAIALAYQRHLLQLAYVDNYLGQVMDRLQALGLWEQAMLVLVADHGLSFKSGEPRRWVTDGNLEDIAPVPLFIKYPGREQAAIVDRSVETIDLLPTIFRELEVQSDWVFDGIALQDVDAMPPRDQKQLLVKQRGQTGVSFVQKQLDSHYYANSQTVGFRDVTLGSPEVLQGLFDVSVDRTLLGKNVATISRVEGGRSVKVRKVAAIRRFQRNRNRLLPAYIQGQVVGDFDADRHIAIALNGTIRAVTQTFSAAPAGRFAAILPEQYFEDSENRVDFFEVIPGDVPALRSVAVIDHED